jgi:chemosensory pili system protein ChpA (sensor histidine kinase/response regulator)
MDELVGKEEVVIKSLGLFLEGVGPFSGATISGEGRVILVLDPARLLEANRAPAEPAEPRGPGAGPAAGADGRRRVLLVDDSVSVRKFVGQMLEKAGFQVHTAVDGQDALLLLNELAVDVVISDLEMPRMDGYTLIEDLRRRHHTREIPIVVLTTRAGEKHLNLARRLGVRHYVTKPVEEEAFVRLIAGVTAPSPGPAALSGASRA